MSTSRETNGTPDLGEQTKAWEDQCAKLIAERDQLRAQLAKVEAERAADLKAIHALTEKEFQFTQEEIFAQVGKEPPLEEIIAKL